MHLCIVLIYILIMSIIWLCTLGNKVQYESAGNVFMVQRKVHNITLFSGMRWFLIEAPFVCVHLN